MSLRRNAIRRHPSEAARAGRQRAHDELGRVGVPLPPRPLKSASQSRSSRGVRKLPPDVLLARAAPARRARQGRRAPSSPPRTPRPSRRGSRSRRPGSDRRCRRPARRRRAGLPERLGDGEPEALADGLLQDARRVHLERVHLDGADVVQVGEDEDVRVAVGRVDCAVVVIPALWVVVGHRADEGELDAGVERAHGPPGLDHPERVLPRVEARDLGHERAAHVDAELVEDVGGVLGRERHVLGRERVDRRRPDVRRGAAARRRDVLRAGGRPRRRSGEPREQEREHRSLGVGQVDVAAPDPVAAASRACSIIAAGCGSWTMTKSNESSSASAFRG